jgi:hypothetical protein
MLIPIPFAGDTLSICISSTWFRVMGGLGNNSAIQANACQARCSVDVAHGLALLFGIGVGSSMKTLQDQIQ